MWDVIKSILTSTGGSFAFVAGILYLTHWVVHYLTKNVSKLDNKMEKVDKLEQNMDSIKENLHFIKATLNVIQSNNSGLTQSHSPIGLTEKGKDVASRMGINEILVRNWDNIYEFIEAQHHENPYDIQQFCIETATINLDKLFCHQDVDKIKEFAFNEGQQLAYYGSMIGVIIRDKYFEIKDIPISEIDRNAPAK